MPVGGVPALEQSRWLHHPGTRDEENSPVSAGCGSSFRHRNTHGIAPSRLKNQDLRGAKENDLSHTDRGMDLRFWWAQGALHRPWRGLSLKPMTCRSFCLFSFFRSWVGVENRRWSLLFCTNDLSRASSKHQVPFAEEVRGVRFAHAEGSWQGCRKERPSPLLL